MSKGSRKSDGWTGPVLAALITGVLGVAGIIINNQQAESRGRRDLIPTISVLETRIAEPISLPRETVVIEVTSTPVPKPTRPPNFIDFVNWQTDFCDDRCGKDYGVSASSIIATVVPGRTYQAMEVVYELRKSGWVLIKKNITPDDLARTKGIGFFYKGTGAPNSIELKLLLRYPGDGLDTTFGVLWNRATDTGDQWKSHEALYEVDFKCWGPIELCEKHDNAFDMESIQRIEFGISNKNGDAPGLGKITFDDLILILE